MKKQKTTKKQQGAYMGLLNRFRNFPAVRARAKAIARRSYREAIAYLKQRATQPVRSRKPVRGRPPSLTTVRRYAGLSAASSVRVRRAAHELRMKEGMVAAIKFLQRESGKARRAGGTRRSG